MHNFSTKIAVKDSNNRQQWTTIYHYAVRTTIQDWIAFSRPKTKKNRQI